MLVVVAAGLALGWAEVRALRALTTTDYGTALLVKSALALPALALGLYNNRRLVPAITRRARVTAEARPVPAGGSGEQAATGGTVRAVRRRRLPEAARAWRHLRRTVAVEAVLLVAVLGATAVLVSLQPAAEAAGITGAYTTEAPFGDDGTLLLTLDPNRVGPNELHVYLLGPNGRPSDAYEELRLAFTSPTSTSARSTASPASPAPATGSTPHRALRPRHLGDHRQLRPRQLHGSIPPRSRPSSTPDPAPPPLRATPTPPPHHAHPSPHHPDPTAPPPLSTGLTSSWSPQQQQGVANLGLGRDAWDTLGREWLVRSVGDGDASSRTRWAAA